MRVKELIELLKKADPDARIVMAGTPDVNGWVNDPLPFLGRALTRRSDALAEVVVLGVKEATAYEDEVKVEWPQRPI